MIIARLADNLLASGTVLTDARAFARGLPAAHLFDPDPRKVAEFRPVAEVTTGCDRIDGNDGAGFVAQLTVGTYYGYGETLTEVARSLNAASSNWYATWLQGATNRYRVKVGRTSGTASLANGSGTNASRNALVKLFGFSPYDRSTAASHTGDVAAASFAGDSTDAAFLDACTVDLGADPPAGNFAAVVGLRASPMAQVATVGGTTLGGITNWYRFADAADNEIGVARTEGGDPQAWRYVRFALADFERWQRQRAQVGYWFWGQAFDTDHSRVQGRVNWEWPSYSRELIGRYKRHTALTGQDAIVEIEPDEMLVGGFRTAPGIAPAMVPGLEAFIRDLGKDGRCLLSWDNDRPNREGMFAEVVDIPPWQQQSNGRQSIDFKFRRVRVL